MTKRFTPERPLSEVTAHTLARLRKSGVLPKMSREEFQRATCADVWHAFKDRGSTFPSLDPFSALPEFRFARQVLGFPDDVPLESFRLAVDVLGKEKPVTLIALRPLIGRVAHNDLLNAAKILKFPVSVGCGTKPTAALGEIYALFPHVPRVILLNRLRAASRNGAGVPSPSDLGRLMALPPRLRMVAACEIFRNVIATQSKAGRYALLKSHEHLVGMGVVGRKAQDLKILATFARGKDNIYPSAKRKRILKTYGLSLRCARDWVTNLFQAAAPAVLQLMPAYTGREEIFRDASRAVKQREDASPDDRHPLVEQAYLNDPAIRRAVKNRMIQMRAIYAKYQAALITSKQALAEGIEVRVPVRGPAVLADGRLGVGRQTLNFRLVRADRALTEAASKCQNRRERSYLVRWVKNDISKKRVEELPILLIYDGAVGDDGSDCAEPFFIDFYRWDLFNPQACHSKKISAHRAATLAANGQPFHATIQRGLLIADNSEVMFARRALTSDPEHGLIAVPLVALFHAMLYAEIAYSATADTGMRALELQQIRINDKANLVETRDGQEVTILRLRPKGFEPLADFLVEDETGLLLRPCAEFTATRWFGFGPGKPLVLPVRELPAAHSSRPLPPAQYLFQFDSACLNTSDVNLTMAALLWGLSEEKIHDRRYGRATGDGATGVPRRLSRRKLNFRKFSKTIEKYDRSPEILASAEAREFGDGTENGLGARDRQGGIRGPS